MTKIVIIISILIISCSDNEPHKFYRRLDFEHKAMLYFSKEIPPPSTSALGWTEIILPINDNGTKYEILIENLVGKLVYDKYYEAKYESYAHFLESLSKGDLSIPPNFIDEFKFTMKIDSNYYGYINPNNTIIIEYNENGFQHILDKYFDLLSDKNDELVYELKSFEFPISISALQKIMYENKLIGGTDCVTGSTRFSNL